VGVRLGGPVGGHLGEELVPLGGQVVDRGQLLHDDLLGLGLLGAAVGEQRVPVGDLQLQAADESVGASEQRVEPVDLVDGAASAVALESGYAVDDGHEASNPVQSPR
jgi:hypothetical protein